MSDNPNANPASGPAGGAFSRPPRPTPLPAGGPRHTRTAAGDTAQLPVQRPEPDAASSGGQRPRLLQQRLQGAFLTIIGIAGIVGGVLFSIEAPRFTPVPVVFLTFWLVMVIVGRILFTGLNKLRAAGVGAPAPHQVRAAAAVAAIVVAVGMMGFAATTAGSGVAQAAPCPNGGPATCGPTGPELTFTPPPAQTGAPGGQQGGQQGGQDQQGIATSPAGSGGDNGPGIQAQTPQFGTPGQQAPNIPGNEQPGQGNQQPAQGQQTAQQSPVQTTAPGRPTQTGQPTQSGQQPTPSTVTVTQTQSQCPAPGAAGAPGAGGPGSGTPGGDGGTTDGPDGDNKKGAPSWAYLVAEATGVMAGRRRPGGGAPTAPGSGSPSDSGTDALEATRRTSNSEGSESATSEQGDESTDPAAGNRQLGTWTDPVDGQQYITETTAGSDEVTIYRPDGQPVGRAPQTLLTKEQADYAKKGMTLAQVLAGQYKNQGRMIAPLRATSKELESLANATRGFSSVDPAEAAALQSIRQSGGKLTEAISKADAKSGLKPLPVPGSGTAASTLQAAETAAQTTRSAGQVLSQSADPALGVIGDRATTAATTVSNTSKAVQAAEGVGKYVRRAGWVMAPAGVALDIASGMSPGKAVTAGVASTAAGIGGAAVASSLIAGTAVAAVPLLPAIAVGAAGAAVGYGAYKGAQYVWDHAVSDGVKQTVDNGLKSAGSAVASGAKSVGSAVSSGAKKIAGWFS